MNTERSSNVSWNNARRRSSSFRGTVGALPQQVFPLLCPVREYDWIDFWKCQMIYSDSGVAEAGCIFTTNLDGEAIWTVSHYDPPRRIEFVVVQPGSHVQKLEIEVAAADDGCSELTWTRTFTALSEAGEATVEQLAGEAFEAKMKGLMMLLDHYCRTGETKRTDGGQKERTR